MTNERVHGDAAAVTDYSPPRLLVLGSVADVTLADPNCWPYVNKKIGPPDFFTFIPITNCSP